MESWFLVCLVFGTKWEKLKKTFFKELKIDVFRAFYRFFVVFFLFVFVLATSHPIRPTTLIFGKLVQCDLERTEKNVFWKFLFYKFLGLFFMFFNFYISFWSLQVIAYGTGTIFVCLTSSYNIRKKSLKKKFRKFWKVAFLGEFLVFSFFIFVFATGHPIRPTKLIFGM